MFITYKKAHHTNTRNHLVFKSVNRQMMFTNGLSTASYLTTIVLLTVVVLIFILAR